MSQWKSYGREARPLTIIPRQNNDLEGTDVTLDNPPVCLKYKHTGNESFEACMFKDSTHILIDILPKRKSRLRHIMYGYKGVSYKSLLVPYKGDLYVYMDNKNVVPAYHLPSRTILANVCADYYDQNNFWPLDYHTPFETVLKYDQSLTRHINPDHIPNFPRENISAQHHIHFTSSEIYNIARSIGAKQAITLALTLTPDTHDSFFAGVLLWLMNLDDAQLSFVKKLDLWSGYSIQEWQSKAKQITLIAKRHNNLMGFDFKFLFEVEVLVNRIDTPIDYAAEKENRVNPRLVDLPYELVYEISHAMFAHNDYLVNKPLAMEWKQFWQARWQWAAAGSVHSQHTEDEEFIHKDYNLRNKFIALSTMDEVPFEYFLNRYPEQHAWISSKYEWGKVRAIYGSDMTNYIMSEFSLHNCEETLPHQFPVGTKANDQYVRDAVAYIMGQRLPFCLDFEDFNSQHSFSSMEAVLQAWLDTYASELSQEQIKAALWVKNSIRHTTIHDTINHNTYRANGTLMTGWRLTSFMNSVLNYVYMVLAAKGTNLIKRSLHSGDDVLMSFSRPEEVQILMHNAHKLKIRFKSSKCNVASISEFLRVDHTSGEKGQYLCRSIATMIHSRIESKKAVQLRDIITAFESRASDMSSRGGKSNIIELLRLRYFPRMESIFSSEHGTVDAIKRLHPVVGGINDNINADVSQRVEITRLVRQTVEEASISSLPGIQAYTNMLAEQLELQDKRNIIKKAITRATINSLQLTRRRVKVVANENITQDVNRRAIYKSYRELATISSYGKAMLTGLHFDVLGHQSKLGGLPFILEGSNDPITLIKILV